MIDIPEEFRRVSTRDRIAVNKIFCTQCLTTVESRHVHDFRWCPCRKVAVDGGREYLKRVGEPTHYIDLSKGVSYTYTYDVRSYKGEETDPQPWDNGETNAALVEALLKKNL